MGKGDFAWEWTPSIFMPRAASRISLEVKGVRIERVQDITEKDAIAEGCDIATGAELRENMPLHPSYRMGFIRVWNNINGKKYPWDSNPYVYVYEFMRVT
jgi:hypothetical protein